MSVRAAWLLLLLAPQTSANALHDAIGAEDYDQLEKMLSKGHAGLNDPGGGGQSPLMMAVLMGKTRAVVGTARKAPGACSS